MKITAIILAAGQGERLGHGPKAAIELAGKTLLEHCLEALGAHPEVGAMILVVPRTMVLPYVKRYPKLTVVAGGATRAASLAAGLKKVGRSKFVLIHNVANPFVSHKEISAVIRAAEKVGAAAVGRPATATVKKVASKKVLETLDRNKIWLTETPQVVRADLLRAGLKIAKRGNITITDDLQLAELAGAQPKLVLASPENIKITNPADLPAEHRTGLGQDSHRFSEIKKPLTLGGAEISKTGGLSGNSDADVILHALCNALSSAIGGGSISTWADEICKTGGKDSREYLEVILKKVNAEGWQTVNCSVTIEAGKPKLEKHLPKINRSLANLLGIPADCVGCTVTSGEKLTSFARGEGIQVFALVLLRR